MLLLLLLLFWCGVQGGLDLKIRVEIMTFMVRLVDLLWWMVSKIENKHKCRTYLKYVCIEMQKYRTDDVQR